LSFQRKARPEHRRMGAEWQLLGLHVTGWQLSGTIARRSNK
jgi:hypothetical protein